MREILLISLLFFGCAHSNSKKNEKEKEVETNFKLYPDSLFYAKSAKEFKWSDLKSIDRNIKTLYSADDFAKDQLLNCLDIKSEILDVKYYASLFDSNGRSALVLLVSSMDSQSFILVTTSNGLDIIDCVQLTENRCDLIEEHEDSEEIWCDEKEAYLTESTLKLIYEFTKEFDFGEYSTVEKDSIITTYMIENNGELKLLNRDSIRLNY